MINHKFVLRTDIYYTHIRVYTLVYNSAIEKLWGSFSKHFKVFNKKLIHSYPQH